VTGTEPTELAPPRRSEPPSLDTAPTPREDETTLMSEPPAGIAKPAPTPVHPKRGLAGDVRYTITVTLGVARARRELAAVDAQIAAERKARDETLAAIGADALADDQIHHGALAKAREELAAIEDERAAHAGTAAGAEAEMAAQRRDRERDAAKLAAAIAAGEAELAKISEQLAPLERDAQAARRRQNEVKETLASIDRSIAAAEASKVAVKKKADPAAIAAEIATLRADRKSVEKDAPAIAAELDRLNPRIATLAADRAAVEKRLRDAREADQTAARRADDVCAAIAARKKVEDRAVEEAEHRRAKALFALGERLTLYRASGLGDRAKRVEERDVAIATAERRALELRDVVASVDRPAVVRGGAVLGAAALLLIVIVWLAIR
jgi:chromosome segregation ATPase